MLAGSVLYLGLGLGDGVGAIQCLFWVNRVENKRRAYSSVAVALTYEIGFGREEREQGVAVRVSSDLLGLSPYHQ